MYDCADRRLLYPSRSKILPGSIFLPPRPSEVYSLTRSPQLPIVHNHWIHNLLADQTCPSPKTAILWGKTGIHVQGGKVVDPALNGKIKNPAVASFSENEHPIICSTVFRKSLLWPLPPGRSHSKPYYPHSSDRHCTPVKLLATNHRSPSGPPGIQGMPEC